jgi:hypothetical protein
MYVWKVASSCKNVGLEIYVQALQGLSVDVNNKPFLYMFPKILFLPFSCVCKTVWLVTERFELVILRCFFAKQSHLMRATLCCCLCDAVCRLFQLKKNKR